MKISFVWGVFPMFIFKCIDNKYLTNSFLCISFLNDIDDPIQLAREKAIVKYNYGVTFIALLLMALSYFVHVYVFLITIAIIIPMMVILYWTKVGEYHRDVRAYAASMKELIKQKGYSVDEAVNYLVEVILKSQKYGEFAHNLGRDRIIQDLKQHSCWPDFV